MDEIRAEAVKALEGHADGERAPFEYMGLAYVAWRDAFGAIGIECTGTASSLIPATAAPADPEPPVESGDTAPPADDGTITT